MTLREVAAFCAVAATAGAAGWAAAKAATPTTIPLHVATGWCAATANALAARWLHARACGGRSRNPLRALAGSALRLGVLLSMLLACFLWMPQALGAFALSAVTASLVFMVAEVVRLCRHGSTG